MAYILPIGGTYIPPSFASEETVKLIIKKIKQELSIDFKNEIEVPRDSVARLMIRVVSTRLESDENMIRRVVMEYVNEVRTHQLDVRKHLKWEDGFYASQQLYDPVGRKGIDARFIRPPNRLGNPKVGGTHAFVFM